MDYTCTVCNKPFKSYNPRPKFCSLTCKNRYQQAAIDFDAAKVLYESGMTQDEVAEQLNTTQKVICNVFKRNSYKARKAAKRNQRREHNSSWKGSDATYAAFHHRVEVERGKPHYCMVCGTMAANRYEWANLTGRYDDVQDYARMCRLCHKKYDTRRRELTGKLTVNVKRKK